MKKKQDAKKSKKPELSLAPEESRELEMIVDRLSVQNPEGESLRTYLESLRGLLADRPVLIAGLLERLSRNPTPVGYKVFLALQDSNLDQKNRRFVKQAEYRFAQRGFKSSEVERLPEKVVLIKKEAREPIAHCTRLDGEFWMIASILPEGTGLMPLGVGAYVSNGFQDIRSDVKETTYRAYRDYIEKVADQMPGRRPVEIPVWHAARLLFEMIDYVGPRVKPAEVNSAREVLSGWHDPSKLPYVYELMPEIEDAEQRLAGIETQPIMDGTEITWLLLPKDDLLRTKQKMDELSSPVIVVPEEIQRQRSFDLIDRTADEIVTGLIRVRFQRFFEEQAMWFRLTGNQEKAAIAWLLAQQLRHGGAPSKNQAVVKFVATSMTYHWPEEFNKAAREQADPDAMHRTESGIFLP